MKVKNDIAVTGLSKNEVKPIEVELPYKFIPRDYQAPVLKSLFIDKIRRLILIWHRRAGKDKTVFNACVMGAMERVGLYLYMLPTQKQAKKVIWQGRGKDGLKFTDHIPKPLIKKVNNTEMFVELVNGSIIQLGGADNYDSFMGTNPMGIIFSEYSLQNPRAWDFFRPILAENGGWAIFDYTPRGRNHGYTLYNNNKKNEKWYTSLLTVDDTSYLDENGDRQPVITEEAIEDDRRSGMDDDTIEQEYYVSFDAAVKGAVFGKQVQQAYKEGRVFDFDIDPLVPCYTFWDLGISTGNAMCVWIMQPVGAELRMVHYYEKEGEDIEHFFYYLKDWAEAAGVVFAYNGHRYPHDMNVRELFGKGRTRLEIAEDMGFGGEIVPRCTSKQDSIQSTRAIFPFVIFHETGCARGIECLSSYQYKYYEELDSYSKEPHHNWASNGADGFQGFGQSWEIPKIPAPVVKKPRVVHHKQKGRTDNAGWLGA